MTAKEYLFQLQILDTKICQKIEEASQLRSMTGERGMKYDGVHVQTSPRNVQEDIITDYIDVEQKINLNIDKYIRLKDKIIDEIHKLDDQRYIQILYMHYVPNEQHRVKRLEEIAVIMKKPNGNSYSYDHIKHLHGEALEDFRKKVLESH